MPKTIPIDALPGKAGVAPAVSWGSTSTHLTGSWRTLRPVYRDLAAPCNQGCPLGNDIRAFLRAVAGGRFDEAHAVLARTTCLPASCGRVCYHPCETACNRLALDEAVSIAAIERQVGDWAREHASFPSPPPPHPRRGRVAVVGSGPAGLSCAYRLALLGHQVEVYEARAEAGGMLRYGIPAFRLPKEILDHEIERVKALGVGLHTAYAVDEALARSIAGLFDAVFVGVGSWRSRSLGIPGEHLPGVEPGLTFLTRANSGQPEAIAGHAVVLGGGNTAIDVARMVRRAGARATVVYRRGAAEMPAHPDEVREAREEGVDFVLCAAPVSIEGDGRVERVRFQRMALAEPDASGRRRPVAVAGASFELDADRVYAAVGEEPATAFLATLIDSAGGRLARGPRGATRRPGLFIGGDAVEGTQGTVVHAMAEGAAAALAIHERLTSEVGWLEPGRVADLASMNTAYFATSGRARSPHLAPAARLASSAEVVAALGESPARHEAERCLHCGACNLCRNCQTFCPDRSVLDRNGALAIDLDHCKGCGICVVECPRNAMTMEAEGLHAAR